MSVRTIVAHPPLEDNSDNFNVIADRRRSSAPNLKLFEDNIVTSLPIPLIQIRDDSWSDSGVSTSSS